MNQITVKHKCKSGCCVMVGTSQIASSWRCYGHLVVFYFDLKWKSCSRNRQMSLVIKLLFNNFSLITGELIK